MTSSRQLRQWLHVDALSGIEAVPFDIDWPQPQQSGTASTARSVGAPSVSGGEAVSHQQQPSAQRDAWDVKLRHASGNKQGCRVAFVCVTTGHPSPTQSEPWPEDEYVLLQRMTGPRAMNVSEDQRVMAHVYLGMPSGAELSQGVPVDVLNQARDQLLSHCRAYGVTHLVLLGALTAQVLTETKGLSLRRDRGRLFEVETMQGVLTLPPHTILAATDPIRQKTYRSQVWEDLQALLATM